MTSVWYVGSSDVRIISVADWAAAGVTGTLARWDASVGWSLPQGGFTTAQLALLALNADFLTGQADGPRSGSLASAKRPTDPVSFADLSQYTGGKSLGMDLDRPSASSTGPLTTQCPTAVL